MRIKKTKRRKIKLEKLTCTEGIALRMTKIKINSRKYTKGKSSRSKQLHARIVGQRLKKPNRNIENKGLQKKEKTLEDKDGASRTWKHRGLETRKILQTFNCIIF
jgi:hypothetical protein